MQRSWDHPVEDYANDETEECKLRVNIEMFKKNGIRDESISANHLMLRFSITIDGIIRIYNVYVYYHLER